MSTAGEKVSVVCPSCNKRLLVPGSSLGKQGRCPVCQTVFTLEQLWEAEEVTPPANNGFGPSNNAWGTATSSGNFSPQVMGPSSGNDYPLQPAANDFSSSNYSATLNNSYSTSHITSVPTYQAPAAAKGQFWDSSVLGGIALMLIAVVWFFGGLAVNIIFIYPPILFIIGLVVLVKGIFAGSLTGR